MATDDFRVVSDEIVTGENGKRMRVKVCEELVDGRWEPFTSVTPVRAQHFAAPAHDDRHLCRECRQPILHDSPMAFRHR